MINLTAALIQKNLKPALILEEPTDKLILPYILKHACSQAAEIKAFLSEKSKEFGSKKVQETLRDAGIEKCFFRSQNVLGWLNSGQSL
ncbi:hypothetical protein [Microcoleus sp. FACHB-672]|uniref:hypothetical protein n=1 Tax=Microcoleus sp. FACHB-672 TaxID=2692825 RepID=UPI001A7E2C5E|nr:hypothetical protein [Microcoleus sp. FACHB-672]